MEFETYADVIDAYNADNMGYATLTDYIKDQNIKIKEIEMDPIGDMQKIFENKADGGVIGIEVKIADEMAKGGRVGLFSGGALKGLASLFKGGKDKIDEIIETKSKEYTGFRSKDDIPVSTYSEMEGPIKISDMENIPKDQLQKILRTQELGLYEETPEILKAANLLERFTKKVKGKRVIDYERAEDILGVKLKGNETLDDLFKIEFETRPVETMADGGRVGLFMGGPALEGQALQIYNSMKGYNFSDQEIADALSARGLYTPAGSGTGTDTTVPNIIGSQINQGRDTGPTRPTSEIVSNFSETIEDRQKKLNKPGKIASFVGDFIPQQRSVADMLASGQVDKRLTSGIPFGVSGLIAKALPDNYYDMSLADQITTQSYMGYTDPNTNMANKDPFGLNVRSAFGNYAEKAAEIVDTLEAKLAKNGMLSNYDQSRLNHYKNVTATKQAAVADLGLINLAKEQQAEKDRIAKAASEAFYAAQGKSDPNDPSRTGASGRRPGSGGAGIATDSTGTSYDTGGREGFGYGLKKGGLATMFTRRR